MDDATAALIGSVATAVIGLIGIVIAQIVSWKTAKLRSKEERVEPVKSTAQGELPFEALPGTGLTGFSILRLDIETLKILMMREHSETMLVLQALVQELRRIHPPTEGLQDHRGGI